MNQRLISAILKGPFLIDERYALTFLPGIQRLLSGDPAYFYAGASTPTADAYDQVVEQNKALNRDFVLTPEGNEYREVQDDEIIPPGSIHVVRLSGVVMKDDYCGVPGTATIKNQLEESKADPNIIGAVFVTDTGGGHVDGTFELVDTIADYGKPIVGFVNGMSCSAGYAMMSRCSELFLCHDTAEVGSVGTAISFYNWTKYLEKEGIELVYINSRTSPDKNQDYFKALEGKHELMQDDLDYLNNIFQESVKAGRPGISAEAITGKCFRGKKAISLGMADSIGTLADAINRVEELSKLK